MNITIGEKTVAFLGDMKKLLDIAFDGGYELGVSGNVLPEDIELTKTEISNKMFELVGKWLKPEGVNDG